MTKTMTSTTSTKQQRRIRKETFIMITTIIFTRTHTQPVARFRKEHTRVTFCLLSKRSQFRTRTCLVLSIYKRHAFTEAV